MNDKASIKHVTGHLTAERASGLALQGSQCQSCGEHYFPVTDSCTRCCGTELQVCELGDQGQLWSWTIQGFLPKEPYNSGETPETFSSYGVGYIELPCGLKVESRLTCADPQQLKIGRAMQLVEIDYGQATDGQVLRTYAFAPVVGGSNQGTH